MTEQKGPRQPLESELQIPFVSDSFFFDGGHTRQISADFFNDQLPEPLTFLVSNRNRPQIRILSSSIPIEVLIRKSKGSAEKTRQILNYFMDEFNQTPLSQLVDRAYSTLEEKGDSLEAAKERLDSLMDFYELITIWLRKRGNQLAAARSFLTKAGSEIDAYRNENQDFQQTFDKLQRTLEKIESMLNNQALFEKINEIETYLES